MAAAVTRSDLRRALAFAADVAAIDGPEPFPSETLDALRELVGCDTVSFSDLDPAGGAVLAASGCAHERALGAAFADGDVDARYARVRHQHPVCTLQSRTGDYRPRKVSDFLTRRALHALELYSEWFRPWQTEDQLCFGFASPTHRACFSLTRAARPFGERERTLVALLLPHLEHAYAAARIRPPSAPPLADADARERLTRREREILDLVAEGRTNAEIAARLYIAPGTVRRHLENVYAKLEVPNRAAAVALAAAAPRAA